MVPEKMNELMIAVNVLLEQELQLRTMVIKNQIDVLAAVAIRDTNDQYWKLTLQALCRLQEICGLEQRVLEGPQIKEIPF